MILSENFALYEFLRSQTATQHDIDMTPPAWVVENLQALVVTCLQPLRNAAGAPLNISSGYRPTALNIAIGGSLTSEHRNGNAADFTIPGLTPFEVCELVVELGLPYDQVIQEHGIWTHLGIRDNLRRMELTAYRKDGKTLYVPGIATMESLL